MNLDINEKGKNGTNIIKKDKNKKIPVAKFKKSKFQVIFPISQFTGKIKLKKNKKYNLINISSEDINFIVKLILKETKNFSPVKSKFQQNLIFFIIITLSLFFSILFFHKKKIFIGILFIIMFVIFGFIYLHKTRKTIQNNYTKCHRKLYRLTDYINRKLLGKYGYYLLIDYNFRFIGIYIIPGYVQEILKLRDHNIELKKKLEGSTINVLQKKENYEEHPKYNDFMNNFLLKKIKFKTERFNNNIKINNFFCETDLIDKDDIIDTGVGNNKNNKNIKLEYAKKVVFEKKKSSETMDESCIYPDYYPNKYGDANYDENNNSQINNKSIDKFKFYFENYYHDFDILNK